MLSAIHTQMTLLNNKSNTNNFVAKITKKQGKTVDKYLQLLYYLIILKCIKIKVQKGDDCMLKITTNQDYLKDMTYEELLEEDKKLRSNPNTTMYEQVYLDMLIGEKEQEMGYVYSLEEVYKELVDEDYIKYKNSKKSQKRIKVY